MPKLILLIALLIHSYPVHASTEPEWVEVAKSDTISLYRKDIPGSSVYAYKAEAKIHAPLDKVMSIVTDTERKKEWAERVKLAKVIKRPSVYEKYEYMEAKVPWPLKNRDFVTHSMITADREKKKLTIHLKSVEHPDYPENPSLVRGQIYSAIFELKSVDQGKATHVLAESHADPKGNIPAFIVNMIQKTFPQKTIQNITKQAQKTDIVPHPLIAEYGLMDDAVASASPGGAIQSKVQK